MDRPDRGGRELVAAYAETERLHELARRVRGRLTPPPPAEVGSLGVALHHRPRARSAGSLFGWAPRPGGGLGLWLLAPGGSAAEGVLVAGLVQSRLLTLHLGSWDGAEPAAALGHVNDALAELSDPPPLVGLLYAAIDGHAGEVTAARGGLPAPLFVPADGPAVLWGSGGPFLGAFAARFAASRRVLAPGERLILRTGLPAADADPLPAIAAKHRALAGRAYADAVARDLGAAMPDDDELTLAVVESPAP